MSAQWTARLRAGRVTVATVILVSTGILFCQTGAVQIAMADDCPDVEVVFARGTNEPPGLGRVGDALVDALRQQTDGMTIDAYGVNYAAGKLQLHGGDGAKDTINHVRQTAARCPSTRVVLGGYSQGASVMDIVAGVPIGGISWGSPLPPDLADHVAAVATFGDVADRAGGSLPNSSALLGPKAIDLCNPGDPICHAGPGNEWSGHTEGYVPSYTDQAAAFVASRLVPGPGEPGPDAGPGDGPGSAPGNGPPLPGPRPALPDPSLPGPASPPQPGLVSAIH